MHQIFSKHLAFVGSNLGGWLCSCMYAVVLSNVPRVIIIKHRFSSTPQRIAACLSDHSIVVRRYSRETVLGLVQAQRKLDSDPINCDTSQLIIHTGHGMVRMQCVHAGMYVRTS